MQEAHGLDMNYINSLNLPNAVRAIPSAATIGTLTEQQIEQIGVKAAKQVKQIFKTEKGIDLEKDSRNLVVLTSAGYVYFNGQLMDRTWDGLFNELWREDEQIHPVTNPHRTLETIMVHLRAKRSGRGNHGYPIPAIQWNRIPSRKWDEQPPDQ